jgi:hypothetical protein
MNTKRGTTSVWGVINKIKGLSGGYVKKDLFLLQTLPNGTLLKCRTMIKYTEKKGIPANQRVSEAA